MRSMQLMRPIGPGALALLGVMLTSLPAAAATIAATSFEEPFTPGGSYTDTLGTTSHALINNAGEPPVNYTSFGGELGFTASYTDTRGGTGLTDGDFVGVTSFTGTVGSFTDGTQGYQLNDTDGLVTVTLDTVPIGTASASVSVDLFVQATTWETSGTPDVIRIWATTPGGDVDLLNTGGADIDGLGIEGSWMTFDADLSGEASATLHFELDSNATAETIYVDNVVFSDVGIGPPPPPPSIIINEIHADPEGTIAGDANRDGTRDSGDDEFVEIVNDSGAPLNLSGYMLSDGFGFRHTFPDGTLVPTDGAVVVFGGPAPNGTFGDAIVQVASTGLLGLNNTADMVTLADGTATTVTAITYGSEANSDESITRDADVSGGEPLVRHSIATGSGGALYSPGTQIDGMPFAGASAYPLLLPGGVGSTTVDFTGFDGSGFAKEPAAGQLDSDGYRVTGLTDGDLDYGLTQTSGDFARGTSSGGVSSGGVYAFDVGGGNIALGVQPAGSDFKPGTLTLRLLNDTGAPIDTLDLAFDLWVNNNEERSSSLDLAFSTDGVNFTPEFSAATPAASDTLGFQSTPVSTTLSGLAIAPGQFLFLQFTSNDLAGSGSRDELAIDNVTLTQATSGPIPEPGTLLLLTAGLAGLATLRRRKR